MIQLDLTEEEASALHDLLEYQHSELRMEIASTDSTSFRDKLKDKKAVLKAIRERLDALQAGQEAGTVPSSGE